MSRLSVYRSERGLIWRVIEAEDGGLSVQRLTDGAWVEGPIGMVGLRLSSTTTKLTVREASALPK